MTSPDPGPAAASLNKASAGTCTFAVVPPGPIHKSKKLMLARFLQSAPGFTSGQPGATAGRWRLHPDKPADLATRRPAPGSSKQPAQPAWVLEKNGVLQQRGTVEVPVSLSVAALIASQQKAANGTAAPEGSNYFVLVRGKGNVMTAFPVDMVYTFKPPSRPTQQTLEEAEEQMRKARADGNSLAVDLAPKSLKEAARELAKDGKSMEAALAALFDDDPAAGSDGEGQGQGSKKVRAKLGGKAKNGRAAARQADEDAPEDIYKGLDAEDRPAQAEDWEHTEYNADDDMDQGEEDSVQKDADDPGQRRELGIDDDVVESALDEEVLKALEDKEEEEADITADGAGPANEGDGVAEDDEQLDLDDMAAMLTGQAPAVGPTVTSGSQGAGVKRKAEPAGDAAGKRHRSATPPPPGLARHRSATPPPPGMAAAAAVKPAVKVEVKQEGVASGSSASAAAARADAPAPTHAQLLAEVIAALKSAGGSFSVATLKTLLRKRFPRLPQDAVKAFILQANKDGSVVMQQGADSLNLTLPPS